MHLAHKLTTCLETHWATPAYAGWVILGLTTFFLLAAANTLAGWLYVLGGLGLGLMLVSAVLPMQTLKGLQIKRRAIVPVSAGESLHLELEISNPTKTLKALLQVFDDLPREWGKTMPGTISEIPAQQTHTWTYAVTPQHRGIYRWQTVQLRSAAPLGLFWCRRRRSATAKAVVYPLILPLEQCPLLDFAGQDQDRQFQAQQIGPHNHNEGVTRSIRPYRRGDPLRLVHWRTSARHNELRTRELEMFTGGQALTIALDSTCDWHGDNFEQAVIATASLYVYGQHQNMQVWTGQAGVQTVRPAILEILAQVQAGEVAVVPLPQSPVIWLTQDPASVSDLPPGSCYLLWSARDTPSQTSSPGKHNSPGLVIQFDQPLQPQLQQPINITDFH